MTASDPVHDKLLSRLAAGDLPPVSGPTLAATGLDHTTLKTLFDAQITSRALDRMSRAMQARGQAFYTIGSSGHEGMAAVAQALRPTDPAFLHYRDGAFQIARAAQLPGQDAARDMVLSFLCVAEDPISGGRHKVLGSKALSIPPQTSTIASHLPKAVGAAYGIALARRRPPEHRTFPTDAIAVCCFGDASLNHSTAQGALNAAGWSAWQNAPLPLLFVCEDNGIGISTKSPKGWVTANLQTRPGLQYFSADGCDPVSTFAAAKQAAGFVRSQRKPAVLHLSTVRLLGHAGPDVESTYLEPDEIAASEARDPLLRTAARLVAEGLVTADQIAETYTETCAWIMGLAESLCQRPRLKSATQVAASLIPPPRVCAPTNGPSPDQRAATFGAPDMRAMAQPQPMGKLINLALTDLMLEHPEVVLMGEDVGRKGGVYGVTQRLQSRFGRDRVVDTLLDEQTILGLAIGVAHNGFVPMPEIQFLAYLHNAEDQLRGEAATLPFFSNGQFTNPMVVRVAGLGYQRGFGGHFHNDNSLAVLRDIPGVVLAVPSNGADAAMMLRECVRLAREEQRVVVFVEPIALYPMRDLQAEGDGGWMHPYPAPDQRIELGRIGQRGDGTDLAIVTYGNGAYLSAKAQPLLAEQGIKARIIDIRWLAPLPEAAILDAAAPCAATLIVDECRRTGSQSEALMALFAEAGQGRAARLTATDSFIATGPAYGATLPSVESIIAAALALR